MKLHFKESGDSKNTTIVFLHGLLASAQNWQGITKRLSIEYHCIALDLPNHGNSPHDDQADYEFLVDCFEAFIEEQDIESFYLIGHSMGGKVAMLYALNHPERIKKLVVEDIAPKTYPMRFLPLMGAMDALNLSKYKTRKEVDQALKEDVPDPLLRMFVMTNLVRDDDKHFEWRVNLKGLIENASYIMSFPETHQVYYDEVLFMCGEKSDYVTEKDRDIIKKYFPKANVVFFKEASHWLHAEKPQPFTEGLQHFLEQ